MKCCAAKRPPHQNTTHKLNSCSHCSNASCLPLNQALTPEQTLPQVGTFPFGRSCVIYQKGKTSEKMSQHPKAYAMIFL